MEDQGDSSLMPRWDSKITENRSRAGFEEKGESARKRVNMGDFESVVFISQTVSSCIYTTGVTTRHPKPSKNKESRDQFQFDEEEMSQVTKVPVISDFDASQAEKTGRNSFALDLNAKVCVGEDSDHGDSQKCGEDFNLGKHEKVHNSNLVTSGGIGVDLNAEDVSSSVSQETSYSSKIHHHLKSRDFSECGSSLGPLDEKDPKRRWEQMKQNGFLSSSYGGIPIPKKRVRKSKNDVIKKKMELAKREQVDRFTKIAAPSGLLHGLNPGIINHVRNRKQVHSIIEALVRSEKIENRNIGSKQVAHMKSGTTEGSNRMDLENRKDSAIHRVSFCQEDGPLGTASGIRQTRACSTPMNKFSYSIGEGRGGHGELSTVERVCDKTCASQSIPVSNDDRIEPKLTSSAQASENASSATTEDSANWASTVNAASVAFQWLELLHQDIKGRLSALQRSKNRIQAVITTELPFLISKEFSCNQETNHHATQTSSERFSNRATADMHIARWSMLFDQMDKALTEEHKELESWLNQVKEMQLQCDRGLQYVNLNMAFGVARQGTSENDSRSRIRDGPDDREMALMAAAASIYSTSNSLLAENLPCF
ncbi:hypothetical protein CJ030_MR3G002731 [Morella rubra]|uniref:Uncharacterized protein n=1 Tax=Morella rubra TaxID=262757 RepID=A0A6A1VX67_9ROSI|nr:hypothetical protein CJ030_MR3G002731 [Morella rubra]